MGALCVSWLSSAERKEEDTLSMWRHNFCALPAATKGNLRERGER